MIKLKFTNFECEKKVVMKHLSLITCILLCNLIFAQYNLHKKSYAENLQADLNSFFIKKYLNEKHSIYKNELKVLNSVHSVWAYGFEFGIGVGLTSKHFNENFGNNIIPALIGMEAYFKKYSISLKGAIAFGKTKKDMITNEFQWNEKVGYETGFIETALGYTVIENEKLKINPFFGLFFSLVEPTDAAHILNPNLPENDFLNTSFSLGFNFDIFLSDTKLLKNAQHSAKNYLRIRYSYSPLYFENKYNHLLDGSFHTITVGVFYLAKLAKK